MQQSLLKYLLAFLAAASLVAGLAGCDVSDDDDAGSGAVNIADQDGDGIPDDEDNCVQTPNPDQTDLDGDGLGAACDDDDQTLRDSDGDGVGDPDNCPEVYNPDQADRDNDGIGDACDGSPDLGPDGDNDGVGDDDDNCPNNPNTDQADTDNDGIGDVCDPLIDVDGDGVGDEQDNCPSTPNDNQADGDNDGIGDVCDPLTDSDGDGVANNTDNCPAIANADQNDTDNDGIGDACDPVTDSDADGIPDELDNCPTVASDDQTDSDADGVGDICDPLIDSDGDGVADDNDNCPSEDNAAQTDIDGDGIGDACDPQDNRSLQEKAQDAGQLDVTDAPVLTIDPDTFAVTGTGISVSAELPSGFDNTAFVGAVGDDAWWQGWTAHGGDLTDGSLRAEAVHPLADNLFAGDLVGADISREPYPCADIAETFVYGGMVDLLGSAFPVCVIHGEVVGNLTLSNDRVYVLNGIVTVIPGATLTIQAGTQVFGAQGQQSMLHVTRGARLNVNGTPDMPVLMAAAELVEGPFVFGNVTDLSGVGHWGGLVIEGFGGDANDNSGSITYLVIAEAGVTPSNQAVPALHLDAVGAGTTLHHIQVVGAGGDGIVWTGGASSASHLAVNNAGDDALVMTAGFSGQVQYVLVTQGNQAGQYGLEIANDLPDSANPMTQPHLANLTILGNIGGTTTTVGALHRQAAAGQIYRSVISDNSVAATAFESGCLDIDDALSADLRYTETAFNCAAGLFVADED